MKANNPNKFYIGCSGWHYKEWKGKFYPKTLSPKEYFSYYATHFNTVEINNTFYCFPLQKNVQLWYQQAPNGFKYSLKAQCYITHIKKFKNVQEPLKKLYGLANILAEKMGYFLFQFPNNFKFTDENLDHILSQLDPTYKNVVEFRHPSWLNARVIEALESANILICSVSGFGFPENLILNNHRAYIRFHGNPLYSASYNSSALSHWTNQIQTNPLNEVWAYFNNTMHGHVIQNALEFKNLLNSSSPENIRC